MSGQQRSSHRPRGGQATEVRPGNGFDEPDPRGAALGKAHEPAPQVRAMPER